MSFYGMLTHTCTVQRNTARRSDRGGVRAKWAGNATGVRMRLEPRAGALGIGRAQLDTWGQEIEFDYVGWFQASVDLQPAAAGGAKDRIVDLKNRRTGTTDTATVYEVAAVRDIEGRRRGYRLALLVSRARSKT